MNKAEFDQVVSLTHFLEKYMQQFIDAGRSKTIGFSEEDQKKWNGYFKALIEPEVLPDGKVFDAAGNHSNYGIGLDGTGYRDEFFQLLMQCYKYLYLALSSGEIFLEHNGWYVSDGKETD